MPAEWDKPLAEIEVPDLATGKIWLDEVAHAAAIVMDTARYSNAAIHDDLTDRHYDLLKIKRAIQNQMGKMVRRAR